MQLNIIVFLEQNVWMAAGLERFFGGEGKTPTEALEALFADIEVTRYFDLEHKQTPFMLVPPAPELYWKMFETAPYRIQWEEGAPRPAELEGIVRMAA